ncbi:hypothetical protein AB6735_14435 [Mucilaginibacter sp. RCC_168]|uniref:hypothetical protein n=1 Tax=Mucilaginibacter sp. RCC_168 TaxID=3239221 RepID=UPI003526B0AC
MTLAEKHTRWEAGVKKIAFNYGHLFTPPIEAYFSIEPDAERPLIFNKTMRMDTIPRNELIALYALIYS